jgi:predicted nuclease of predicted toxin-antitoxin system
MRLLLDQNLSRRLVGLLVEEFPDSVHVSDLGLDRSDDLVLWDLAKRDGFLIASKDTDFLHLSMLRGHPPKVVYLEIGNCPTQAILRLLKDSSPLIAEFVADPIESFLILRPK